ncbi:MAG: ABC transporter ATP-binding protein, partial [Methyloligellaceae bacterium]
PIEAKRRIGYLPEGAPLYSDMTPHSFLNFIADIHGIDKSIRADRISDSVAKTGLEPVYNQVIDTLSKGFKRRVGLAQAILNDPDVLILDEPTDGLDPNQKHLVRELISTMAKEKAIIISTHILEEVEAVCSRAVVIDQGRVIVDGTADELQGRSSHYNAVTLKTAEADAGALIEKLEALELVKQVETLSQMNGTKRLRAIPVDGKPIASDITSVLQEQGTVVQEIYVEQVRLDDVFRQLTTPEGE